MKYLGKLLTILTIAVLAVGCTNEAYDDTNIEVKYKGFYSTVYVVTVDSCRYVAIHGNGDAIIHAANCGNHGKQINGQ